MAGYTQIPRDLTTVKSRLLLNLTKRQLICFGSAVAIGIPTYLFTRTIIGNSAAVFVMIGLMLPFFFFAMFEKDGLPAEKILRNLLRVKIWHGKRAYKTENLYINRRGNYNYEDDTQINPRTKSGKNQ